MANTPNTPGVYVQEIQGFSAGVAQIPSAVPVFIGLTANTAASDGTSLVGVPASVTSMREVPLLFGGPPTMNVPSLALSSSAGTTVADTAVGATTTLPSVLYHSLELYFANGGGPCYVISLGAYGTTLSPALFLFRA